MIDTVFSPAFGNKPRTFVGRDQELMRLTEGLHSMPGSKERATLIIGQRGMGKTVLLLELAEYARAHDYIVASPTVVSGDMLDRILEKLEKDGSRCIHSEHGRVTGGSIGFLGFSAGIQTEAKQTSKRSFAYRLLEFCEKAAEAGKGVLILVDEVQSGSEELKQLIIAYQEMVGEEQNITVVFAGLPAAIAGTLNQHVLTFLNRASKLFLEPISITEIEFFFRSSFEKLGIAVSDEQIRKAAEATEGSPYMMQLIGHTLTVAAAEDGSLTEKNFQYALSSAKKEFIYDICETTLSPLSGKDINFLRAMSVDEQESSVKDIALRLHVDSSYIQRYKTRLSQAGVITQQRRGYVKYAVPYLREYFLNTEEKL